MRTGERVPHGRVHAGLWPPVSAPYTACESRGRRRALAELTRHGAGVAVLWHRLAHNVGGEHQVIQPLDAPLAASVSGWRLTERDGCPKIMLAGRTELESGELAAVQALALLLESGGTGRLKRCRRGGCHKVFLDWTNAGTRLHCRACGRNPR